MELAGPLGTPLGLAQWKRASSRGEAALSSILCLVLQGTFTCVFPIVSNLFSPTGPPRHLFFQLLY